MHFEWNRSVAISMSWVDGFKSDCVVTDSTISGSAFGSLEALASGKNPAAVHCTNYLWTGAANDLRSIQCPPSFLISCTIHYLLLSGCLSSTDFLLFPPVLPWITWSDIFSLLWILLTWLLMAHTTLVGNSPQMVPIERKNLRKRCTCSRFMAPKIFIIFSAALWSRKSSTMLSVWLRLCCKLYVGS